MTRIAISPRLATSTFSNIRGRRLSTALHNGAVKTGAERLPWWRHGSLSRRRRRPCRASSAAAPSASSARAWRPAGPLRCAPGRVSLFVKRVVPASVDGVGRSSCWPAVPASPPRTRSAAARSPWSTGLPQPRPDHLRPARHRQVRASCVAGRWSASNLLDAGDGRGPLRRPARAAPGLYTSRDSAEDIEAIRVALGDERIALFGRPTAPRSRSDTRSRYPGSVERLVLDSVVEAEGPNPLYLDTSRPCRACSGCSAERDAGGPLPTRSPTWRRRAAARPPAAARARGRKERSGSALCSPTSGPVRRVGRGDLDPALRAAFPGAVRAALDGDAAPLLRLRERAYAVDGTPPPPRVLSSALYAATTCEETPFPWPRTSPPDPAARRAAAGTAAAALPAGAFFFDRPSAVDNDLVHVSERWLAAPNAPVLGAGPLPDVPVLLLEGEDDLRTPVENARRVAAGFPRARLLVAPGTGHSALGGDVSGCTTVAFGRFMQGAPFSTRCPRGRRTSCHLLRRRWGSASCARPPACPARGAGCSRPSASPCTTSPSTPSRG